MIKISGLSELTRQLEDAQAAMANIDGQIGTVSFECDDPASIEAAIQEVERMINEKLGQYESNLLVAPIIANLKTQYREAIVQRAAEARLENQDKE